MNFISWKQNPKMSSVKYMLSPRKTVAHNIGLNVGTICSIIRSSSTPLIVRRDTTIPANSTANFLHLLDVLFKSAHLSSALQGVSSGKALQCWQEHVLRLLFGVILPHALHDPEA